MQFPNLLAWNNSWQIVTTLLKLIKLTGNSVHLSYGAGSYEQPSCYQIPEPPTLPAT